MRPLAEQRCFNHPLREAAARCPECGRFFCRECVTEHEERLLCALCLKRFAGGSEGGGGRLSFLARGPQALLGLMTLWLFFYLLGLLLVSLPSTFHEGTLWQGNWLEGP